MTLDDNVLEMDGKTTIFRPDTELGSVFKNLDSKRELNKNTRLSADQISSIIALEGLQDTGVLDKEFITIGHKFKELNISKDGKGREEKIRAIAGERKGKEGNFFSRLFKKRGEE